ncbi:MAG: hypothetical protein HQL68_03605 [Magnetococcales bacterium]|nr:hypothetical protein [Magnetococcales bacterium]
MCKKNLLLTVLVALSIIVVFASAPAQSASVSDEQLKAGDCGFMCHVPMAYQGGGGPMAWYSLGNKSGSFQLMKLRFRIREDQEEDWAAFEKVVLDQARAASMGHCKPPRSTLEKAEFMEKLWKQKAEQIRVVKEGFNTLYKKLDPMQQKIAGRSLQFCELPQQPY